MTFDLLPLGLRVEWAGSSRFPWDQVKAFIAYAPTTSAIVKADVGVSVAEWTVQSEMLASIEYHTALLVWAKTEDGRRNNNRPVRRKRPALVEDTPKPQMTLDATDPDAEVHVIGGRGVPIEDMARVLGWDPPPADRR